MAKTFNEIDSQAINLIGKGTQITGDIHSEGDIRIDGDLAGNLQCTRTCCHRCLREDHRQCEL